MAFILLVGLFAFFVLWIAKSKGFFVFPFEKRITPSIRFKSVLIVFGIYLCVTLFLAPLLLNVIYLLYGRSHSGKPPPIGTVGGVQLLILGCILLFFYLYARFENPTLFKRIWKNWNAPNAQPITTDIGMGVLTWFIAFPLVAVIGEISDMLLYSFFGLENYEQVAVRYLKTSLSSFETMIIPLFIILLVAPTIEEFLFRGCWQTFLKKYMSIKTAIVLSSLCFALFHFAPSQGLGNVSLVASLFTFALFLGFIYERQSSLFASIALHITFNTFSTLRILFFPD
jgi:membrane protease YdiL (CAAX protease family)